MGQSQIREYTVQARSTDTFGRVLCSCRQHHFIVDGPIQNGCPGEAITPAELFLSGVASCGVELLQVVAREQNVPLEGVKVNIWGIIDRDHPVRSDVTLFNKVRLSFQLKGVNEGEGAKLIETFKGR